MLIGGDAVVVVGDNMGTTGSLSIYLVAGINVTLPYQRGNCTHMNLGALLSINWMAF